MTVCIAGICLDHGLPRCVLCSDQRIETDEAGGDVCLKLDHAGDGWFALIAGNTAKAREFVAVCRKSIMDRTDTMGSADFAKAISVCAQAQKRTLADNYVRSQLAVSYDYLLKQGKTKLPERHFDEVMAGVRAVNLDCQVILSGFLGKNPFLFTVESDGTVYREESFAAIGAGARVAQSALFRRQYRGYMPIEEATYYLYEAKKFSEVAPGVGPSTMVAVTADSPRAGYIKWQMVNPFYMARLENEYKDFGPQNYVARGWPEIIPGLSFREDQSPPEETKHDLPAPPASPESP